jgi:transposase-like protein
MQIIEGILNEMFLSEICMTLDISQGVVRKWRREDKAFDEAYTDAEASVTDTLEKEAIRRARNGVLEPVISKGQLVMVKDTETGELKPLQQRRYSDNLLQFLLKGRRREVYGDKREVDATVGIDVVGAKAALEAKFAALG